MDAGAPVRAVALKLTGVRAPTLAVAICGPAVAPMVQVTAVRPAASVVLVLLLKLPPPFVASQLTVTPESGLPEVSDTLTTRESCRVPTTVSDWALPARATMEPAVGVVTSLELLPQA